MPRSSWKKYNKEKFTSAALMCLVKENITKYKTIFIIFSDLEPGEYLQKGQKISVTKIIFNTRSKTFRKNNLAPLKFKIDFVSYQNYPYSEWSQSF